MNRRRTNSWLREAGAAAIFFAMATLVLRAGEAASAESTYRPVLVGDRVRLEIPRHWYALDAAERKNLAAAAEGNLKSIGLDSPMHVASLAVNAAPAPPGAMIRVSYVQGDALTQEELSSMLRRDRSATMAEIQESISEELNDLAKVMSRNGLRLLDAEEARVEQIGGRTAIAASYRRTSLNGNHTFQVRQYRIPLGAETVIVTLSCREQDSVIYRPILEHVKSTLQIL